MDREQENELILIGSQREKKIIEKTEKVKKPWQIGKVWAEKFVKKGRRVHPSTLNPFGKNRMQRRHEKHPGLVKMLKQGVQSFRDGMPKRHKNESLEAFKKRRKVCNAKRRKRENEGLRVVCLWGGNKVKNNKKGA